MTICSIRMQTPIGELSRQRLLPSRHSYNRVKEELHRRLAAGCPGGVLAIHSIKGVEDGAQVKLQFLLVRYMKMFLDTKVYLLYLKGLRRLLKKKDFSCTTLAPHDPNIHPFRFLFIFRGDGTKTGHRKNGVVMNIMNANLFYSANDKNFQLLSHLANAVGETSGAIESAIDDIQLQIDGFFRDTDIVMDIDCKIVPPHLKIFFPHASIRGTIYCLLIIVLCACCLPS
jgi:hypothetical protein